MTDFNANETMRRLANSDCIWADTPEGQEIIELVNGMGIDKSSNHYLLASYAYTLGLQRGKRLERARRKAKGA